MTEDRKERLDRELIELLNELRVAITGVQVLFAFLLTVPFAQRFEQVTSLQLHMYFVTLLCAAAASAFLIAPSAYHRLRFRQRDKEQLLLISNYLAVAGLTFLALAMVGAILLITDVLFRTATAIVVTGLVALLFVGLWYALPLSRLRR